VFFFDQDFIVVLDFFLKFKNALLVDREYSEYSISAGREKEGIVSVGL